MLHLPPQAHAARELIDIAQLAELADATKRQQLPTLKDAKAQSAAAFLADKGISTIHSLVLCADDTLRLFSFGPNGGKKAIWTFGKFYA